MKPVAVTRKPYSGLTRSVVIAIDVGTTFSGVSYAILEPGEIPKIYGVTRFPGQEHVAGNSKIPSLLYYDKQGELKAAGAEANNPQVQVKAEEERWIKVDLFKLRLRPRTMHLSMSGLSLAPLPPRRSPVHVFGDYLAYLYRCTTDFIRDSHANGHALLKTIIPEHLEFVLAHPNGWEGAQQAKMRRAAVYGGLVSDTPEGRAKVRFVTEGEASLHACVLSGLGADVLSNPSKHGFLVADAGGGTLDISSYAIKGSHPLVMEEIAPPDCIFAGSVFVSRRAKEFFDNKLKGSQYGTPALLEHITKRFDETTKRLFRDSKDVQFVPFGSPLDNDSSLGIKAGQLMMTGSEVADLFEPSVNAAYNAIKKQIEASGGMIKSVFLVGGYAASPWLFSQLQERLGALNIAVSRPDTQTSQAVADGAIGFYCDHHVSTRMSRFMYGVEYLRQLDPNDAEHLARQEKLCELPSGPKLLPEAFDCILARSIKVKESTVFTRKYCTELTSLSMLKVFEVEVWCYRGGDTIPKWIDRGAADFSTLCIVRADLSVLSDSAVAKTGAGGRKYWTIVFSVEIHFGLTEFTARIKWVQEGVTKYGPATIVYNERGYRGDEDEPDLLPEDDALTAAKLGPSRQNSVSSSRYRTPVDVESSGRSTHSVAPPSIKIPSNPPTPSRSHAALEKDRGSVRSVTPIATSSRPGSRASIVPPSPAMDRRPSSQSARRSSPRPSVPPTPVVNHPVLEPPNTSRVASPSKEASILDPVASPAKAPSTVALESERSRSIVESTPLPQSTIPAFGTPKSVGERPRSTVDNHAANPVSDGAPSPVVQGGNALGIMTTGSALAAPTAAADIVPASPAMSTRSKGSKRSASARGSPAVSRANSSSQGQAKALSPLNPNAGQATIAEVVDSVVAVDPVSSPAAPTLLAVSTPTPLAPEAAPPTPGPLTPALRTPAALTPAPPPAAEIACSPPVVPPLTIPSTPAVPAVSVPATPAEESSTPITPTSGKKKKKKGGAAAKAKEAEEEERRAREAAAAAIAKAKEEEAERERKAKEEEERRAKEAEEEERKAKEAAAAEEEARRKAEEEERERKAKEEEERKAKEAAAAAEEEARRKAEEEEARRKEEARIKAEEEARAREEEEARIKAEAEAKAKEEEEARLKAALEAKAKEEEEARLRKEEEARKEREREEREEEERKKKKEEEERLERERIAKEEAEREAENARMEAERQKHELEIKRLAEEEERVKKELEDLKREGIEHEKRQREEREREEREREEREREERQREEREREAREREEREKDAQTQKSSFGFPSLGGLAKSASSLFGSGNEDSPLAWSFGTAKSKSPTPEPPKRTPSLIWGGANNDPANRNSISLFDSLVQKDTTSIPSTPVVSENKSPIPIPHPNLNHVTPQTPIETEDEAGWGSIKSRKRKGKNPTNQASQQPTRASTPQPPASPAPAPTPAAPAPAPPPDSLASEAEEFVEALEAPPEKDAPTPKQGTNDLIDFLESTNNTTSAEPVQAQDADPDEEWGLPVKTKKGKKGKKAANETDPDPPTGAESKDDVPASAADKKKKKKGKK